LPDARFALAVASGKAVGAINRALRIGGGTTLPGHVATAVDPALIAKASRGLLHGSIVLTGTNGKTTTARLLSDMLAAEGLAVVHNRAGANLISGIASAIVANSPISGRTRADIGVFEVDEAAVPEAIRMLQPRVVTITNLFRDQLDRYGEIDYLLGVWREALSVLPSSSTVVLNADDPAVASLGDGLRCGVLYYGVDDPGIGQREREHASDSTRCPRCGSPLDYQAMYYSHIGLFTCAGCGASRPTPEVSARDVRSLGPRGTEFLLQRTDRADPVTFGLPGLYNVYNALAASATARAVELSPSAVVGALQNFRAAFGRIERIRIGGRELFLALVKNPVGFNQVLRTILGQDMSSEGGCDRLHLAIIINDHFADGTDISWLWDVDFERLAGRVESVVVSGTRAADMALRLKYAGVELDRVVVIDDPTAALSAAVDRTPVGATCYALPTYTAMLGLRSHLAESGLATRFWEN
jgi:lipid II isoglutaminyl synthase (glutamine-hydrolysing)